MKNKNNLRVVSLVFLSACLVFFSGCASQEMSDAPVTVSVSNVVDAVFSDAAPGVVEWGALERAGGTQYKSWSASGDTFEIVNKGLVAARIQLGTVSPLLTAGSSSWQYKPVCKLFGQGDDTSVSDFPGGDVACSAGTMQNALVDVPSANHDTVQCLKYTDSNDANPGIVIEQTLSVGIDEPLGDKTATMVFAISIADPDAHCNGEQGYLNI
jgi:hypothetical protein